jgi:hypothetical protein
MVVMIVAVGAVVVFGIVAIWYLFARGPQLTMVSRADFDAEYDELVANGDALDSGRESAWEDFHAQQLQNERERLAWEEGPGE